MILSPRKIPYRTLTNLLAGRKLDFGDRRLIHIVANTSWFLYRSIKIGEIVTDHIETLRDDDGVMTMLDEVCQQSGMGFAAVARVTEDRWIACQVLDKIQFGLKPGDELAIKTTICDDIRRTGKGVIIDDAASEEAWQTHPVPILYGFKSYISLPIILEDGSFFGTLCAIDPEPRTLRASQIVPMMERYARKIAAMLSPVIPRNIADQPICS